MASRSRDACPGGGARTRPRDERLDVETAVDRGAMPADRVGSDLERPGEWQREGAMVPGWLDEIEEDVVKWLGKRRGLSPRELAQALEVSEASALSYILLLAATGRVAIERVGLMPTA